MWNIEKFIKKGDYIYAKVRNHPNRTKNNYVLAHRVIVENSIGRLLESFEVVHHINGDKKDNRIENLQILTASEHASLHGEATLKCYLKFQCPMCLKVFDVPKSYQKFSYFGKARSCSRKCGTTLGRLRQLNQVDSALQERIDNNFIEMYYK